MKVIAVDFDGCLCEANWPDIGAPRMPVIRELLLQQAEGAKIILWTCREGEQLQAAVMWCLNHGIKFDAINDNLKENKERYGNNCRKVWATEYWDDKSVLIVGNGKVTSICFSRIEGGMTIKKWLNSDMKLITPPTWKPKKKKKWWQIWR